MDTESKQSELAELKQRVADLESQIAAEAGHTPFQPEGFYTAYYATTGFMLGILGAMASLLFNVVGSLLSGLEPLELIRTYLTFPLGDRAFDLPPEQSSLMLAIGCCLYLGTGMVLGVPVYLAIKRWGGKLLSKKLVVATVVSLAIWLINFYGILSWLQPEVIKEISKENLIVERVPWWVAAATHLVFGWTMALVSPLGDFVPYQRVSER